MTLLTFGLHRYSAPADLVADLRNLARTRPLDEVVDLLLDTPGPHVLPHLRGNPAALPRVRERYLELLRVALPREDLRAALRRELEAVVKSAQNESAPSRARGDDDIAITGRSIDCGDSWMPTWLCEWWNEPSDPDPPPDDDWPDEDDWPPDGGDDDDEDGGNDCPHCMECSPIGPGIPMEDFSCWDVPCEDVPDECRLPTS